jgi:hypothetical protein
LTYNRTVLTENQEIAIQESAFRFLYNRGDFGQKESVKTLYIDIGEGELLATFIDWKEDGSVFKLKTPSERLISALKDLPVEIRPGLEFQATDPNRFSIQNEQGQSAILFGVGPIIKSVGLARCRTYYDKGMLCAAEYESLFIWTPLGWKHLFSFPYFKS